MSGSKHTPMEKKTIKRITNPEINTPEIREIRSELTKSFDNIENNVINDRGVNNLYFMNQYQARPGAPYFRITPLAKSIFMACRIRAAIDNKYMNITGLNITKLQNSYNKIAKYERQKFIDKLLGESEKTFDSIEFTTAISKEIGSNMSAKTRTEIIKDPSILNRVFPHDQDIVIINAIKRELKITITDDISVTAIPHSHSGGVDPKAPPGAGAGSGAGMPVRRNAPPAIPCKEAPMPLVTTILSELDAFDFDDTLFTLLGEQEESKTLTGVWIESPVAAPMPDSPVVPSALKRVRVDSAAAAPMPLTVAESAPLPMIPLPLSPNHSNMPFLSRLQSRPAEQNPYVFTGESSPEPDNIDDSDYSDSPYAAATDKTEAVAPSSKKIKITSTATPAGAGAGAGAEASGGADIPAKLNPIKQNKYKEKIYPQITDEAICTIRNNFTKGYRNLSGKIILDRGTPNLYFINRYQYTTDKIYDFSITPLNRSLTMALRIHMAIKTKYPKAKKVNVPKLHEEFAPFKKRRSPKNTNPFVDSLLKETEGTQALSDYISQFSKNICKSLTEENKAKIIANPSILDLVLPDDEDMALRNAINICLTDKTTNDVTAMESNISHLGADTATPSTAMSFLTSHSALPGSSNPLSLEDKDEDEACCL